MVSDEAYQVLIGLFIIFYSVLFCSLVGYYSELAEKTNCYDDKHLRVIAMVSNAVWIITGFSIIALAYPTQSYGIKTNSGGAGSVFTCIVGFASIIFYSWNIGLTPSIVKLHDCMETVAIVVLVEVYLPLIILILFVVIGALGNCTEWCGTRKRSIQPVIEIEHY